MTTTMCEPLRVTEASFRAAHPGLLEKLAALDDDQRAAVLCYLKMPRWQLPVWRFRNWLRRHVTTEFALLQFLVAAPLLFMLGWAFWSAVQQ